MKKGDTFKVVLGQYEVAEAVLVEIDGDNAILEIPSTRIVMGIQSTLGELAQDPNSKDRMLLGLQEDEGEIDPTRAELEAAGIELDDDDVDFIPSSGAAPSGSLKDMDLDGLE